MSLLNEPAVWFPAIRAGSGTDVFTERLAEGLQKRGIKAEITWLPHRAEYAPWTIAKPQPPAWANIVHVNTWLHRRLLPSDIPIVATMHHCVHGEEVAPFKTPAQALYHRLWVRSLEQAVLRRANQIVAVSRYTAEHTKSVFQISDFGVIPNGIDLEGPFQFTERTSPRKTFRLLFVGNWSARKGVDLLAPIMTLLGENFELLYTGSPSGKTSANMHAVGKPESTTELVTLYQEADALLFPSRLEGFGLVALEAQACGLPVIATRGSALPEVVEDRATGLLCPQDDIQAFAGAARKLAMTPGLWLEMRQAARKRVESRFSLDAMIDLYLDVYYATMTNHLMKGSGKLPHPPHESCAPR